MSDRERLATTVLSLDDPGADLERVGGKGASLSRLARAGIAVPGGFCVTTDAYHRFVAHHGLTEPILAAVSAANPDEPRALRNAAERVTQLFGNGEMPADIAEEIRDAYREIGAPSVAVRSSATAEDLPEHSFAGQQETYLNIQGDAALRQAVRDCWASLWTARAIGYRSRAGIAHDSVGLAVVIQRLIPADASGVAFTADPVTGDRERITINAAWGLGEAVVSGAVTADTLIVGRDTRRVIAHTVADKTVMTVRDSEGTHEEPVPEQLRGEEALPGAAAETLAEQCVRIEELYGSPMDIEWARQDDALYILQARPITVPATAEPEVWNDSLEGDFLWTSANVGEAVPSVMTPLTWSLFKYYIAIVKPLDKIPGLPQFGRIGGRMYMNLSLMASFGTKVDDIAEQITGKLPAGLEIPTVPRGQLVKRGLPVLLKAVPPLLPYLRQTRTKIARCTERLAAAKDRIRTAQTPGELAGLWDSEIHPTMVFVLRTFWGSTAQGGLGQYTFGPWLRKHGASDADINVLATGAGAAPETDGPLASLGPLVGLAQLSKGEIDRQTFTERWGHRGPDEFELSAPRPAEDPDWVERRTAEMGDSITWVNDLLESRQQEREEALARFIGRHPGKARKLRRRMAASAKGAWFREAGRSEWVRAVWTQREFVLRAGQLTDHGEDLFYLDIHELLDVLRGAEQALSRVPARRAAYARYRALPTYPAFIRGRFDPERWAADPNRRVDVHDEHHDPSPASDEINGSPGAAGIVDGIARVVSSAAEAEALLPGEILVTVTTNVGWTPLFPRAAAVVTDVGAPLSHAAIVARELGIPAVVGCADATTRMSTGDRIRVDGARGTVEILATTDAARLS